MPSDNKANVLLRLWNHLSRRRKQQFMLLLVLILCSAFAEIISLGAVLPFLGILTAPDRVFTHPVIADVARAGGITSAADLVLPLTIVFIVAALVAGGLRLLLLSTTNKLAYAAGADLSIEVYRRTLYQPYSVHVARNSSEVISSITQKVGIATGVLLSLLSSTSSFVLFIAILATLLAIDVVVASVAAIGFGASYGVITWFARRRLERNGVRISQESNRVIKALQEGLGGIRDVLLDGTQRFYCDIYRKADVSLREASASNSFISQGPRYAIEAMGVALIAVLAYSLTFAPGGVSAVLPVLGALAFGAQRLLPVLQQLYGNWSNIAGSRASLENVIELLDQPLPENTRESVTARLTFQDSIRFDNVCFRYNPDGPWVLDGLDFEIRKGMRVGFVGSTGSGKSTALDLLMGLLEPTKGQIRVDGQSIDSEGKRRAWQRNIAHVPQSIYLADTTLGENIAFGLPSAEIDLDRVRDAARQAQIAAFIESRPEGYNALVGERGIRLSGGERQRIGVARALYKQASVLVFDEATSALDNATELALMEAIEGLNRELTVLLIAHRLTTVQRCDQIIELGNGRVVAQGTFNQLRERSTSFRQMLQAVR